jgi:hypothetical protein
VTGGDVCVACGDDAISVGTPVCAAAMVEVAKTIKSTVGTVRLKPDATMVRLKPDTTVRGEITRKLPL